jgi:hypothetical protein
MKWFKHETDAKDSEKLKAIIDEFGFEGYGRWFRIMEIIAEKMDDSSRCHYEQSEWEWCCNLKAKRKQLTCFLKATEKQMLCKVTPNGKQLRIEIPNLLKKRDNYSKHLQVADNKKTINFPLEVDREVDREVDNTYKGNECEKAFENCWDKYPRKAGNKKKALACFKKTVWVKGADGLMKFNDKMDDYIKSVDDPGFLKHGETFFRNWQDLEVSNVRPIKKESYEEKREREMQEVRKKYANNN